MGQSVLWEKFFQFRKHRRTRTNLPRSTSFFALARGLVSYFFVQKDEVKEIDILHAWLGSQAWLSCLSFLPKEFLDDACICLQFHHFNFLQNGSLLCHGL